MAWGVLGSAMKWSGGVLVRPVGPLFRTDSVSHTTVSRASADEREVPPEPEPPAIAAGESPVTAMRPTAGFNSSVGSEKSMAEKRRREENNRHKQQKKYQRSKIINK